MLEVAAAAGGRFSFRGMPLSQMVNAVGVAFSLQHFGLMITDVIYSHGMPDVIVVRLTAMGHKYVAQCSSPTADHGMPGQVPAASSPQQRLQDIARRFAELQNETELIRAEHEAVMIQLGQLQCQLDSPGNFIAHEGVLWHRAWPTEIANGPYCPVCKVPLGPMADDNRLACPDCDFTAPFRPWQTRAFRPKAG